MGHLEKLEDKLVEYENEYKRIIGIPEDDKRVIELQELLQQYGEDSDILELARIYSWGSWNERDLERISRIRDLESNIFHNILHYEIGKKEFERDEDRVVYIISEITHSVVNSKLLRHHIELECKKYAPTPEDLTKRMTI